MTVLTKLQLEPISESDPFPEHVASFTVQTNQPHRRRRLATILETGFIQLQDSSGCKHRFRALFDNGSQRTIILADSLKKGNWSKIQDEPISITGAVSNAVQETSGQFIQSPVYNMEGKKQINNVELLIMDDFTHLIPKSKLPVEIRARLENFCEKTGSSLADPDLLKSHVRHLPFDIIIGNDYHASLDISPAREHITKRLVIKESPFGTILSGPVPGECSHIAQKHAESIMTFFACYEPPPIRKTRPKMDEVVMFGTSEGRKYHSLTKVKEIRKKEEAVMYAALDAELQEIVQNYYQRERGEVLPTLSTDKVIDKTTEEFTRSKMTRDETGRYSVSLPWREECLKNLSINEQGAKRRWNSLVEKFVKSPALYDEYRGGIERWLDMGALERVPLNHLKNKRPGEYSVIPHHVVYKETSTTTKARVVCDAAAHEKGKLSINDAMSAGSNLLPTIFDILTRIRFGRILVVGDIDAAFLQIGLNPEDADKLFFYWVRREYDEETDKTIWHSELYRFKRLPWGLNASPFLLLFVLHNHLLTFAKDGEEVEISKKIIENLYMDDLIRTFNDAETAVKEMRYATDALAAAGFPLRKLNSNDAEVKRQLGALENDPLASSRVLGFLYDPETDSLRPDVAALSKLENLKFLTPRLALRAHSIVFDPMGLAEHWHFKAKILMQKTWDLGLGWDDKLPEDLTHEWFTWIRSWRSVQSIKVPRFTGADPDSSEFHVFCDASEQGYAAGVYVVTDGKCRLLCSKAKVIPVRFRRDQKTKKLKLISIPRAELLAAELGTKLWKSVSSALHTSAKPTFWSDSQTALWWIKATTVKFKVFVSNRVDNIREVTEPSQWRHVPGKDNPADLATREVNGFEATSTRLWFKGPRWISEKSEWPNSPDMTTHSNSANLEVSQGRPSKQLAFPSFTDEKSSEILMLPMYETVEESAPFESILPPGHHCQLTKACQVLVLHARGLKEELGHAGPFSPLVELCLKRDAAEKLELSSDSRSSIEELPEEDSVPAAENSNKISIEEMEMAKHLLIKLSQQHYLPGVTACLQEESLSKREDYPEEVRRPVFELGLRMDEDGIIRSYGRTALTSMRAQRRELYDPHIFCPDTSKPLILIPGNGFLGECIMRTAHLATMHWGRNAMTNWTRSEYWVINPSKLAAKVKRKCEICTNYYSKPFSTVPSGLPEKRFSPAYPFQHIGLDYVSVRFERKKNTIRGKIMDQEKYIIICLFTCMVTRAVHLEYAENYSKEEFARVFQSFCHRRAIPETVLSDNGSNFVPIANRIQFVTQDEAEELFPKITWQFLPREAPNWGGFYERLNKSVKDCLAKEFPRLANKPYMEIESALAEITYRLNCRPLWVVSMDRDDVEMLTPNHFLIAGPTGNYGQPSEKNIAALRFYHEAQKKHLDELWHRFARSYLSALRVQHNWDQSTKPPNLKIGDFVMVPQDKILKTRWPVARIKDFIYSSTGQLKAAKIEVYISDRVNTRLKNDLFGTRTRIKDLTPDQVRQVAGCFIENERPVLLSNLYPYEMWEDTEADFPMGIKRDELPTNFPFHPKVLTEPLADFSSQKANAEEKRRVNKIKQAAEAASRRTERAEAKQRAEAERAEAQKRKLAPVTRDDTDRPRRQKAKYDQNYQNLASGNFDND